MIEYHKSMLENEIKAGRINPISIEQILYDIITMSMSTFMSLTAMKNIFDMQQSDINTFLINQRTEIINKIYYRLYGKLV